MTEESLLLRKKKNNKINVEEIWYVYPLQCFSTSASGDEQTTETNNSN